MKKEQIVKWGQKVGLNKKNVVVGVILLLIILMTVYVLKLRVLDVSKDIKPEFSGYSSRGKLEYNSNAIEDEIERYLLKREGVKKDIIEGIVKKDDNVAYAVLNNADIAAKVSKVENELKQIEFGFDKKSNLKNGDTVIFKLQKTDDKIPIKEFSKKFTVSGLKESKTIGIKDIVKENKVTFEGFDSAGSILINGKKLEDNEVFQELDKDGNLKNGEKLKLVVSDDYIVSQEEKGNIFDGIKEQEVEVQGLKPLNTIANLKDIVELIDDLAKSKNKNEKNEFFKQEDTFVVERLSTYIAKVDNDYYSMSVSKNGKLLFNMWSIYKIEHTEIKDGKEKKSVYYKPYGYSDLSLENGNFNKDGIGWNSKYTYDSFDSVEATLSNLKTESPNLEKLVF